MANLWTDEAKYQKWLEIEVSACEAWAQLGEIPKEICQIKRPSSRLRKS
jgi:adenylosuccinate lyase